MNQFAAIFLPVLLLLSGCRFETEHSLRFWDRTEEKEGIIINKFMVDGKEEPGIRDYKPRKKPKKYDPIQDYLSFSAKKHIIHIQTEILYKGKTVYPQCTIDTEKDVCLILISFNGTENLDCVCDGFSRHYE